MISVVIVDVERDVREGLQKIINRTDGFQCLGTFSDAHTAFHGITKLKPEVALVNLELPHRASVGLIRQVSENCPGIHIIVLSDHSGKEDIVSAFQAGAFGFLKRSVFPSRLLDAIKEVVQGGAPMSPTIARQLVTYFNQQEKPVFGLSVREKEVLHLLCHGNSYRSIALSLQVSQNTVRFHLKNIYKKLKVNSRHEAVLMAMRAGVA